MLLLFIRPLESYTSIYYIPSNFEGVAELCGRSERDLRLIRTFTPRINGGYKSAFKSFLTDAERRICYQILTRSGLVAGSRPETNNKDPRMCKVYI